MAKSPRTGKARLRTRLRDADVESLAACFFRDTLSLAQKCDAQTIIAFAPEGGSDELRALTPSPDLVWTQQSGSDLGERLASVLEFAIGLGFRHLVCIGTDSPTLPGEYLSTAIALLGGDECDIVLCPAADGGYCLIGVNEYADGLFDGVKWGTAAVLEQTEANASKLRLTQCRLPEWYDIDTFDDLIRLRHEMARLPDAAPATRRWMAEHGHLFRR